MIILKSQYSILTNQLNNILYLSFLKQRKINTLKKILVAPLNWGLGHATRCIPVINALIKSGFQPIIASDGEALTLLQLEFPYLKSYQLPSYNITYPKNGKLHWHLIKQLPHLLKTIKAEHRLTQEIIQRENIAGIISDNRFGIYNKNIPSVYISHQLKVLSGMTTFLSSYFHHQIINKFDECWIPDSSLHTLSGKLSIPNKLKIPIKHIGVVSRLKYQELPIKYNICVLLSGPEPQRTILENILLKELQTYKGTVCFVRGIFSEVDKFKSKPPFTFYNFLTVKNLNNIINQSDLIIARSGYSTILDVACLGKKAFFIPTPGQTEQEYLARNCKLKRIAPYCKQSEFNQKKIDQVVNYKGFLKQELVFNYQLFKLFN